jgi:histidinol dehydrogenase
MGALAVRRWEALSDADRRMILARSTAAIFDDELHRGVAEIVADVRDHGDAAIVRALARFDGVELAPADLRVQDEEFELARASLDEKLASAIRMGIENIRRYNERVLRDADWMEELSPGVVVGEKTSPILSAGLFVPSGKGSFPSVLMQIGTPATVAGVPTIAVVVPPMRGSTSVDPAVLVVASELGIRDVFRVNGPAGIAALAFGTESIPRVGRVVGPGSPAVAAAQLQVHRYGCSSVMLFGPSEAIVLADEHQDPLLIAADLLNEAEHGPDSAALLVTPSEQLVQDVSRYVDEALEELPEPRREYAASAISKFGGAIIVRDLDEAVEFTNEYAPEHLLVATADPDAQLAGLRNAGEILLGDTPIVAANLSIGVPATLPTGGFARFSSGVTARTFTKTTSIARTSEKALERLGPSILALCEHEGFPAHARSIHLRRTRVTQDA